jgi:hypothetical protein
MCLIALAVASLQYNPFYLPFTATFKFFITAPRFAKRALAKQEQAC